MLRRYKISTRIIFLLVLMLMFIVVFSIVFFRGFYKIENFTTVKAQELMLEGQKQKLKTGIRTMAHTISSLLFSNMTERERVKIIKNAIGEIRFEEDKSGYYFVFKGTIIVADGTDPKLIGHDRRNVKDANGVYFSREMAKKASQGGGFTRYVYNKPGFGNQPKLSYSEMIPGTEYWIGTGIYIDNIEKEKTSITQTIGSMIDRLYVILIISIAAVLILFVIPLSLAILKSIVVPLKYLITKTHRVAIGDLNVSYKEKYKDEISEMGNALQLLVEGLKKIANFSLEIGKGNYESSFVPLSKNDVLGNSLLDMRKSLKDSKEEEEKRQTEDRQRSWTTQGIAMFGDLLRGNKEIAELVDDIIKNLVDYLKINQGGLFLINDEDPQDVHIELISAYAYNLKRIIAKRIEIGEGIVGTCSLEKKTIFLTKVPENYIEITSGLGDASPTCLLVVPLLTENEILGIIELASFTVFEKYEIEFVEKVAQSIASTLSSTKINDKTAKLLKQTQTQTQAMQSQEEEMRQNLEEMQATQEESRKREMMLIAQIQELEKDELAFMQKIQNLESLLTENEIAY